MCSYRRAGVSPAEQPAVTQFVTAAAGHQKQVGKQLLFFYFYLKKAAFIKDRLPKPGYQRRPRHQSAHDDFPRLAAPLALLGQP